MILQAHCTHFVNELQIAQAVKKIACKRLLFANGDLLRTNEFERLYGCLTELLSNPLNRVLHEFSLAVPGVRKAGTSKRITVI